MRFPFPIAFALAYTLFTANAQLSSSELQKVIEGGLHQGGALVDLIAAGNFNQTLLKLANSTEKFLNAVGPLVGLFVNSTTETKLMQTMKEDLAKINRKFILSEFDEIKNLVDMWSRMHSGEEKSIRSCSEKLNSFMEAKTPELRLSMSREYTTRFHAECKDEAYLIYYTFTKEDMLLPRNSETTTAGKYSEKYREEVRSFMLALTHLMLRGAELEIAYYGMTGEKLMEEVYAKKWKTRMGEVASQMRHVDETLRKALLSQKQNLKNDTNSASIIVLHHFDIMGCLIICYFTFFMDFMQ